MQANDIGRVRVQSLVWIEARKSRRPSAEQAFRVFLERLARQRRPRGWARTSARYSASHRRLPMPRRSSSSTTAQNRRAKSKGRLACLRKPRRFRCTSCGLGASARAQLEEKIEPGHGDRCVRSGGAHSCRLGGRAMPAAWQTLPTWPATAVRAVMPFSMVASGRRSRVAHRSPHPPNQVGGNSSKPFKN